MSWFKKLIPSKIRPSVTPKKKGVPEGLWCKCPACQSFLFKNELERNLEVCPKCEHHLPVSARQRLAIFLDDTGHVEIGQQVQPVDRLKFRDTKRYKDRLHAAQKKTGETDALIVYQGTLLGMPVVACAFEFSFIGGSMGAVVGERFALAVQQAQASKCPLVCFAASGGARMQESLISLMQMAKTSAALAQLAKMRLPYISVMTHPCTGGVSASLAMLGDLNLAEPRALIGFAGPRVIEQTVRETLPEGFQSSEFLLEKGFLDRVVDRREMRETVHRMLQHLLAHRA